MTSRHDDKTYHLIYVNDCGHIAGTASDDLVDLCNFIKKYDLGKDEYMLIQGEIIKASTDYDNDFDGEEDPLAEVSLEEERLTENDVKGILR